MADRTATVVVGFDLGHGESALSKTRTDTTKQPEVMDVGSTGGGRQHVTAVAEHPTRGVLVGREAADARGVTWFDLGFKSPEVDREEVRRPVLAFVAKVSADAVARDRELDGRYPVRWVFGAPSGWSAELRRAYATMLKSAGLQHVDVVSESRAAMLYARESDKVTVSRDQLAGSMLVVDMGSSTTDFTHVLRRHAGPPIDSGLQLGAGLIDRTILERQLRDHPEREALEELLHNDRQLRLRLELRCREAKERFFRTDPGRFADDPDATVGGYEKVHVGKRAFFLEIELNATEMDVVLDTPQPSLQGRSWRQAFRAALDDVCERLPEQPNAVLLTGGASRMHFVQDQTREVFGADRVLIGLEPEVAIAQGLALAGRMSLRAAGFRSDIRKLLKSDRIGSLVQDRLPALGDKLGEAVADGMTERHVIPAFRRWRVGESATLNDMASGITAALHAELTDPDNPRLKQVIADWQNALRPDLEELTRPICRRWHIPPSAMALPTVAVSGGKLEVPFDAAAATEVLDNIAKVMNVLVAGVVATTLFGAGTAIIAATGPFAVLVAFAVVWAGLQGGKEAVMGKAREANMPLLMRKVGGENRLITKLRQSAGSQEAQLAQAFSAQFLEDGGQQLMNEITKGIAEDLDALAESAELLIS
ncbi:Hsp70 family protein [Streptomyces sp. NPDC057621]|uniref:Hsp70 family protein n=1 Tax=Streptomyces sp. NPDC057621 TaxID=3346186 RepID=UPI00369DD4CE